MWVEARRAGIGGQVAVANGRAHGTVGELADALQIPEGHTIRVDGQMVERTTPLSESPVMHGSIIDHGDETAWGTAAVEVAAVAGPDAGQLRSLSGTDVIVLGRDRESDILLDNPTVSSRHAVIRLDADRLTIEDLESRNGTWVRRDGDPAEVPVDGVTELALPVTVRVGSIDLRLGAPADGDRPVGVDPIHADDNGRVLLNRPPRETGPVGPSAIVVPDARPERANPFFSPIALVAPILFGIVMVLVLGSWRYALFAVLSPVMLLSGWLTNRRRVAAEREKDQESFADGLERLAGELHAADEQERARRRSIAPHLAEVHRRAGLPSVRLWERRPTHADAFTVGLGVGRAAWSPPIETVGRSSEFAPECQELLDEHAALDGARLLADLRDGPLGVIGDAELADGVLRSVIAQLCVHHGPADLSVVIVADQARLDSWRWARWLPHVRDFGDAVRVLTPDVAVPLAAALEDGLEEGADHHWLFVVDEISLVHERASTLRTLLASTGRGVLGLVVAPNEAQLPASVATVVDLQTPDGRMEVRRPAAATGIENGIVDAMSMSTAASVARSMARWEDPEQPLGAGGVPSSVEAAEIFGVPRTPALISERWAAADASGALSTPLGLAADGRFDVDLVADGPHALVAGTTGAGKSELLRTWLLGLAHRYGPHDVVFVLIDYKGGAAFDALRNLPHVVGMVTDLDAHLAERALRSLEAELRYRERALAAAAVSDVGDYRRAGSPGGPLPRLVVMIDEFATLRAELPDFVDALVGIAQRGRSLGVHLVLATQRPAGAVDANIRANTNLRIALRVQTDADALDVIDDRAAVEIPRSVPGRAWVRRGTGDLTLVQAALCSVPPLDERAPGVVVTPVSLGDGQPPRLPERARSHGGTVIEMAVAAMRIAAADRPSPRRPWLPDLPAAIAPAAFEGLEPLPDGVVPIAVGDDPDHQRRVALGWDPAAGSLAVMGGVGSGVSTTLRSVGNRLQQGVAGRVAWVFAADHGDGSLGPLRERPHVSCVLDPADDAGHLRLLDLVDDHLRERARTGDRGPLLVLLVDGIAGFVDRIDGAPGGANAERLARIIRDGPALGVVFVAGASRPSDVPKSLLASVRDRVVLSLADPLDLGVLGVRRRSLPAFVPGRALFGSGEMVAQVADQRELPGPEPAVSPPSVAPLGAAIPLSAVGDVRVDVDGVHIPFAVDDRRREPASLRLRQGEHALVAGPARSGRTTALRSLAIQMRRASADLVLVGVVAGDAGLISDGAAGPFDAGGTLAEVSSVLERAAADTGRPWVVFIDDAERCADEDEVLHRLVRSAPDGLHVIASVRTNSSRSDWPRWLRSVRGSGVGLLLNADPVMDAELLGVRLPRGERTEIPGRGWLVHAGTAALVQVADPG